MSIAEATQNFFRFFSDSSAGGLVSGKGKKRQNHKHLSTFYQLAAPTPALICFATMKDATGETERRDSFIHPSSICTPRRGNWLHYEAVFQELEHGVRSSLQPQTVCANL